MTLQNINAITATILFTLQSVFIVATPIVWINKKFVKENQRMDIQDDILNELKTELAILKTKLELKE